MGEPWSQGAPRVRVVPLMTTLAHADAVTDWNETAIRAAASVGISTGWQSRIVAITHAAMFDAVNSIERKYTPYAVEVSPPAGASAEAAAITAAHAVLTSSRAGREEHARRGPHHHVGQSRRWRRERCGRGGWA